jgi:hypothetical protein
MKKENKNIFLHIIDEDYKANKQSGRIDISEKTSQLIGPTDISVIEQLRKMHGDFEVTKELEQLEPTNELIQTKPQESFESMNSVDVSELYAFYQKAKAEEKELIERKQDLQSMEQDLRERLSREICQKKKAIEALHLEISALQNNCKEISQVLSPTAK